MQSMKEISRSLCLLHSYFIHYILYLQQNTKKNALFINQVTLPLCIKTSCFRAIHSSTPVIRPVATDSGTILRSLSCFSVFTFYVIVQNGYCSRSGISYTNSSCWYQSHDKRNFFWAKLFIIKNGNIKTLSSTGSFAHIKTGKK